MDIAIFGGSFDPFHIGHEKIVKIILQTLNIDKLFIIPTFLNPFKNNSHLDANIRLELLNILYSNSDDIEIIDYEVKQNKKVSTYETINYLKNKYNINKIYLIIGADNLKDIHLWYNFKNLNKLVQFVVISRNNIKLTSKYINPIYIPFNEDISSTQLRKNMELKNIPTKIQNKVKKLWKLE
jgi:nicotinate-nucleotide adenylyltransferase